MTERKQDSPELKRLTRQAVEVGALMDFGLSCECGFPVEIPLFAVEVSAKAHHSVDSRDGPSCSGLLESAADHVFARSFNLAAADRFTRRKAVCVIQMVHVRTQIGLQACQRFSFRFRTQRLMRLIDER